MASHTEKKKTMIVETEYSLSQWDTVKPRKVILMVCLFLKDIFKYKF